jgi:hypothetical protein
MNFLIIGTPRSGSTMLCDYLNQQNDIKCHYEVFLDTAIKLSGQKSQHISINHIIKKLDYFNRQYKDGDIDSLDFKLASEIITSGVNKDKFNNLVPLIDILKKHNNKKYLGFKIFYSQIQLLQNFNIIDYIKENNIKVLHLYRKNKFLQELSYQKRKQTNIVRITKDEPNINQKIIFDVNLYKERSEFYNSSYERYEQLFIDNNIQRHLISYEDISNNEKFKHLNAAADFISNSFTEIDDNNLRYKKMNVFTLEEQIENFTEVKNSLIDDSSFQQALI